MNKYMIVYKVAVTTGMLFFSAKLAAKPEIHQSSKGKIESIQVLGDKYHKRHDEMISSNKVNLDEIENQTESVAKILSQLPGISLNGQGGLFQVYSIRGLSGARVQSQIAGIAIHSQRKAGSSLSFIDPFLLNEIEVVKGASSTFYGSGAIGGVVQLKPKHFDELTISSSYVSAGEHSKYNIGLGNENYSFAFSHNKANNSKTASDLTLNSQYQQTSASFITKLPLSDNLVGQLTVIPSYGKDIGKANSEDFINEKLTIYPQEKHLFSQFALISDAWQFNLAAHEQKLDTQVTRFNKRINTVTTESTDFSSNFIANTELGWSTLSWGLDQTLRSNVKTTEQQISLKIPENKEGINLSAEQYDAAFFASSKVSWQSVGFSTGLRQNVVIQTSSSDDKFSDNSLSGFASVNYDLDPKWRLLFSLSRGFRFPTLAERFYNGTTARGQTLGNLDLSPETSINTELTLNYNAMQNNLSIAIFNNDVKNYIERIQIDENTRSYNNTKNGIIKGIEFSFSSTYPSSFYYQLSGHYLSATDDKNQNLTDISPNKLQLDLGYQAALWQSKLTLKRRFSKSDFASGEQKLNAANIVNANIVYDLDTDWQLSAWVENLLDKEYLLTMDKKSALSTERTFGIRLTWFKSI